MFLAQYTGASVTENRQREAEARPRRQHADDRQPTRQRPAGRERVASRAAEQGRHPANAGQRYPAEILTPDEVRALIKACSNRAPTGIRNRALLVLLYRGGLRITEALRLHPKDLDRAAGTVTVLRGKGGKRRTIGLEPGRSQLSIGVSTRARSGGSAGGLRSSARCTVSQSRAPTCGRSCPGSRGVRESRSASTPTGFATRTPRSSRSRGRP